MRRFIILILAIAAALSLAGVARAAAGDCYLLEEDGNGQPDWTITEADNGVDLIWNRGGEKVVLTTGSIGTGIPGRTAAEPDGTVHTYRYFQDMLWFDMQIYYPGCVGAPAKPKPTTPVNDHCFVSDEDPAWTLTEGESVGKSGFIWKQGSKEIPLETGGSIGPGRDALSATEPDGTEHAYLMISAYVLIMDMTVYNRGCPM